MEMDTDEDLMLNNVTQNENGLPHYQKKIEKEIENVNTKLIFGVEDYPPLYIALLYGMQVALQVVGGPVVVSFLIHKTVCATGDDLFLAELISSSLFCVGLSTILQVMVGIRLPILQGSSILYVAILVAITNTDAWSCPDEALHTVNNSCLHNESTNAILTDKSHLWKPRVMMVSGGLIMASMLHTLIGLLGIVGFLTNFIGPLTISPVIGLIGLSFFGAINSVARHCWPITILTVLLSLLFAIVMGKVNVPLPMRNEEKGWHSQRFPLFKIFSTNFAIILCWALCIILTVANVFPSERTSVGYYARTDVKMDAVYATKWFYVPFPGQWGMPQFSWFTMIGYIPVVMGSVIESIGDYIATATVCKVKTPPKHALNRGIAIEGLGSILSGLIGVCHATTSYSSMIGLISYTGVAARFVWLLAGTICVLAGVFGKVGALLATIPEPVVGGLLIINLGLVFSSGIAGLAEVDMALPRNRVILGIAFLLGIAMPISMTTYPEDFKSGYPDVDLVVSTLLSNGPIVGGIIGFVLDNALPGTKKSRGMIGSEGCKKDEFETRDTTYDIPGTACCLCGSGLMACLKYVPFLPCYDSGSYSCKRCDKQQRNNDVTERQLHSDADNDDS